MNTSSSISAPKVGTDMQLLQALVYAGAYNWCLFEVCNIEYMRVGGTHYAYIMFIIS